MLTYDNRRLPWVWEGECLTYTLRNTLPTGKQRTVILYEDEGRWFYAHDFPAVRGVGKNTTVGYVYPEHAEEAICGSICSLLPDNSWSIFENFT